MKKMKKAEMRTITVTNGHAFVNYMSVDGVTSGGAVKGFVWEDKTFRPIKFADGIENTIIKK